MKKILLASVSALVSAASFASGILGTDQPQAGIITVPAGPTIVTNSFNPSFTVPPVMIITLSSTNAFPFTNNFITSSNFAVQVGATNSAFAWQAFLGYPVNQSGTNVSNGDPITNTFSIPYAYVPKIVATTSGLATNAPSISGFISTVSPRSVSGFIMTTGIPTNQTVSWQAIGEAYRAGTRTVTY